MQPYRESAERIKQQGEQPLNTAKNVAGTAATAYFGGGALNRVLPFLSKYIPESLAIKGLNKIDPRYGKFIDTAMAAGETFEKAKEFIGEKIESSQESAKQDRNIIEQVSPELHQFVSDQLKQGRNAYQAGAIAQKDKRFSSVIEKLQKDHKVSWADILEQIYGQGQGQKKKDSMMKQEADRFDQEYGAQQQQEPPQQGLDPGVAQILQQGASILQKFKGSM